MKRALLLALALVGCRREVGLGETCAETKACGKGADCYRGVCTPLCADDGECDGELVCVTHRCLLATGEPRRKVERPDQPMADKPMADRPMADKPIADRPMAEKPIADKPMAEKPIDVRPPKVERLDPDDLPRPGLRSAASSNAPTDPATMAAELKALRNEVENLRKEQQRLNEAIDALKKRR